MCDEQGKTLPTRITKWDALALFASTLSGVFDSLSQAAEIASGMLEVQASFVEDKQTFHEYAARTIETLQEGEE